MAQPKQAGGPPPVTQWMQMPQMQQTPANCPPGLEYLTQVDQLLVHQQVELLEAFVDWETNNKYEIKNSMGQRVYFAGETTGCLCRQCCGAGRAFDMEIKDNNSQEVIHITRPLRCRSCLCFCCLQEMTVEAPIGNVVGYVKQKCTLIRPHFEIQNENQERILDIYGPCVKCNPCGGDVKFPVYATDGTEVGMITKQWAGIVKEAFTDSDNFGVAFPMDLDVKAKASLLAAVFLLDFMFYEQPADKGVD